jgi:enoyl-CoA hydratase/carnithine racemase
MTENRHLAFENLRQYQNLLVRVLSLPMATVSAINGHAFAGRQNDLFLESDILSL